MTASNRQITVHLRYHHEDDSWWAESEQLPGLFAGGDTLDDAKELARGAVRDELGEDVSIFDWMPVPVALEPTISASRGSSARRETFDVWVGPDKPLSSEWLSPKDHSPA
jgi:hypothetical protein